MIELSRVSIQYNECLLKDAMIKVPPCSVTLIKGLSGTGKTTLLYRIGLVSKDNQYDYQWNETNVNTLDKNILHKIRRHHIGYVFQDFCLFEDFNVYENLVYYSKVAHKQMNEEKARELLKSVQLEHVLTQVTETLSNGEKQRLAIACALTKDPELLVLDEPTSALDEDNERNVFSILRTLAHEQGKTIVVASHSYIADDYADCIYTIENQNIVSQKYEEYSGKEDTPSQQEHKYSFIPYYLKQYFKKHIFMNLLMVMIILFGCLCSMYIQSIIQETMDNVDLKINQYSDHQAIVMAPNQTVYTMFDGESISSNIVKEILQRKEVKALYPMYNLTVEVGYKQYPVVPLFDENQINGKLYSKRNDDRYAYLSYLVSYENENVTHISNFIFNNDIEVSQDIDISGVISIGKSSEFTGDLRYVMMNYSEIEKLAQKHNIEPVQSAYVLFANSLENLSEVRQYLFDEYHLNIEDSFQDTSKLLNMKTETVGTMGGEKIFVVVLTLLLFLYLEYWNIKGREKEFVLLHINGISDQELIKIMIIDLFIKLLVAFVLTLGVCYIFTTMQILHVDNSSIIEYFSMIGSFVMIGIVLMTYRFINKLNPERTLRN